MENTGIELAPESIDLNDLLGLTNEDIAEIAASSVGIDDVVVEEEIDEPHITLSAKKILDMLKVSAIVSSAGENSFEGKVIVFNITDDKADCLLSDNKRNICKNLDIVNEDNRFTGFLAFSSSDMARMIKVCGSSFSIIKRVTGADTDGEVVRYYLKIKGGELALDNIRMQKDKFVKDLSDNSIKEYNKESTLSNMSRLFTFASTSIKTGKNIDFDGNSIQATPINSMARVTTTEKYPTFRMSLIDSKVLYLLSSSDDSETLGISKDGKTFTGNTFVFRTESFKTSPCVFDAVASRMLDGEYATVDLKHLSLLTDLSIGLDTSIGNLKFNIKDGRVECEVLTKRENSKIILEGTTNEDLVTLEKSVEIPSQNLKGALTVFPSETTVNLRVSTDGISLQSGNVSVSVLGKGVGK